MSKFHTLLFFAFALTSLFSCQEDDIQDVETSVLFSVDLDPGKFTSDYKKSYIAAYTPQGELLKYGSLSDSSAWVLKAPYEGNKIDIVFFEIWHGNSLMVNHIKNVNIGQVFTDPDHLLPDLTLPTKEIVLKVEDFGNRDGNSTAASFTYECRPHSHIRGYSYPYGEFMWDKVENNYTYKKTNIEINAKYQGTEIILFERGTNKPYVKHIDIAANSITSGDTITLHKSDFVLSTTNTVEVNSVNNAFNNIFLYTYNSHPGRRDMITSFENVPNTAAEKKIKYVSSSILPIDRWEFTYRAGTTTNYYRQANTGIPSVINVQELTGHNLVNNGNQSDFTHGSIFPGKILARSTFECSKVKNGANFHYSMFFDNNESIGTTHIVPVRIPDEILSGYANFIALDALEWQDFGYSQTYTDIPGNSPLDFLKNSLLRWVDRNSSDSDYTYEVFSIML
ncbi:hypothetical protein [Flavobacterium humi]|uniref:Uncharacterized protein n=1 Tax=Flavobacterium humi TaxID=2562683 RepID=A0A4Z0L777_9FLAO|nr:hypothetical protein [Flavobacterium humi]TGD58143.1 hypothetical protein E4635_09055 [Flavobacterium humi]